MNKIKKIIIGTLGFLVLAAGIVAGTYLVQKNQDIREKAAPSTSLSFFPTVVTKNPGQTFNLTINADTGTNQITGIDIEISFDPSAIQLTQMKGTAAIAPLSSIIKNGVIDNTAGKARFVAYTAVKTDALSGNLDILEITGNISSGAASGQFPIAFTATTTVSAVNEGQNVIINSTPATVTVTTGSVSATATATSAAVTPTKSPSPTPTTAGGVGGANLNLATATPTTKPTTTATSKPAATTAATVPPDLPVTGVSISFLGSAVLGIGAIVLSLFLAF